MIRSAFLSLLFVALLAGCASQPPAQYTQAAALIVPPDTLTQSLAVKPENPVDFIVVQKQSRVIALWKDGSLIKTYPIMAMGANPVGQKVYEGDERTPEGQYYINEKHVSNNFQKFMNISYPNAKDVAMARKMGLKPGGNVGFHGDRGGVSGFFQRFDKNWTDGCIAMRNADLDDMYDKIAVGTPILIKP